MSKTIPEVRRVNKGQLAEFFGVSITTVGNWLNKGCPALSRGTGGKGIKGQWQFDLLDVAAWRFTQGGMEMPSQDPESMNPQDRRNWYTGEEVRLRTQEKQGVLIPVEAAATVVAGVLAGVRAKLLSHHNAVATLHPDLGHAIIKNIQRLNNEALEELSSRTFPTAMRNAMERVLAESEATSPTNP